MENNIALLIATLASFGILNILIPLLPESRKELKDLEDRICKRFCTFCPSVFSIPYCVTGVILSPLGIRQLDISIGTDILLL